MSLYRYTSYAADFAEPPIDPLDVEADDYACEYCGERYTEDAWLHLKDSCLVPGAKLCAECESPMVLP